MKINDLWTGHARLEYFMSANSSHNSMNGSWGGAYNESTYRIDRAYVEGKIGDVGVSLGRFGSKNDATPGLVFDGSVTGAEARIPVGHGTRLDLTATRYSWLGSDFRRDLSSVDAGYADNTWTYFAF